MPLKGPLTKHHIQRDYGLEIKMLPQLNSWCLLTKTTTTTTKKQMGKHPESLNMPRTAICPSNAF